MCHITMGIGYALWNASLTAFATVQTSVGTHTKTTNELTEQYNLGDHCCTYSPLIKHHHMVQNAYDILKKRKRKIQETVKRCMPTQDLELKKEMSEWDAGDFPAVKQQRQMTSYSFVLVFQKPIAVQHKKYTKISITIWW